MPPVNGQNLSDTRGNALGIGFFKVCLRLFGPRFCCLFVWFVAAFYAAFDRRAFHAASPYLRSRFPRAGRLRLRWHFYRLITTQGQAIILAYWLRSGHTLPFRDVNPENAQAMLQHTSSGYIMLLSHVGCWQATIPRMNDFNHDVSLLIQTNLNDAYSRLLAGEHFHIISNQAPFGGLLDCTAALDNHHVLCLMGDRLPPDAPSSLALTLHGRTLRVPAAPWLLAARCHVPVFPVFTVMRGLAGGIDYIYLPPVRIDYQLPRKPQPAQLEPFLKPYHDALEDVIDKYPYQVFHYDLSNP